MALTPLGAPARSVVPALCSRSCRGERGGVVRTGQHHTRRASRVVLRCGDLLADFARSARCVG